jgi:hypothetical protein
MSKKQAFVTATISLAMLAGILMMVLVMRERAAAAAAESFIGDSR